MGYGASKMPQTYIVDDSGALIAKVSYNGRVWPPVEWTEGMVPLYDNRMVS